MQTTNGGKQTEPGPENDYLASHVALLLASFRHWTGRNLVDPSLSSLEQAAYAFHAPFALLSHDTSVDPILNYANRIGLRIFDMSWEQLVCMPSRLTAEPPERNERARLLAEVSAEGYIDNYAGIRVSANGRRFRIERATVWNLIDVKGAAKGQAATFTDWRFIS